VPEKAKKLIMKKNICYLEKKIKILLFQKRKREFFYFQKFKKRLLSEMLHLLPIK